MGQVCNLPKPAARNHEIFHAATFFPCISRRVDHRPLCRVHSSRLRGRLAVGRSDCGRRAAGKGTAGGAPAQPPIPPQIAEFFETKIRPVLAENCFSCHGPKKQQANLRLDSREALLKGSENGPVIVSGQPDKSLLIHALRQQGELRMPPRSKLAEPVIADFAEWIKLGVPWPASKDPIASKTPDTSAGNHWSFQPVRNPAIPVVKNKAWPQTPVDAFILAKLEAKGLNPNPVVDRRTLLRRLKFDMLGLPPTFEEVAAFEADKSGDAYSKLVDRYLASPQYGERWARHWLDVARYADTKGYVVPRTANIPAPTPIATAWCGPSTTICPTTASSLEQIGRRPARAGRRTDGPGGAGLPDARPRASSRTRTISSTTASTS